MSIVNAVWKTFKGMSLLVVLVVLLPGIFLATCLLRLFLGSELSHAAGRLYLGS